MATVVSLYQANITASAKTSNLLSGTELSAVPTDDEAYILSVAVVSSAVAVNLTLQAAGEALINDREIVSIGTSLLRNDHALEPVLVAPGQPLQLFLRETAGTATTDVAIEITATGANE